MKSYFVYILASGKNGTLYTGVTSDLAKRMWEHRKGSADGFTKKYGVKILVYFERTEDVRAAIEREKRIKKWRRSWKIRLIEEKNRKWRNLYQDLVGDC